jgi:hypothetical protein
VLVDHHLLDVAEAAGFRTQLTWHFDGGERRGAAPVVLRFLGHSGGLEDSGSFLTGCVVAASRDAAAQFGENPLAYADVVLLVACDQEPQEAMPTAWHSVISRGGGVVGDVTSLFRVAVGLLDAGFFDGVCVPGAASDADFGAALARAREAKLDIGSYGPARRPVEPEKAVTLARSRQPSRK